MITYEGVWFFACLSDALLFFLLLLCVLSFFLSFFLSACFFRFLGGFLNNKTRPISKTKLITVNQSKLKGKPVKS